jgi:hypothetical protein
VGKELSGRPGWKKSKTGDVKSVPDTIDRHMAELIPRVFGLGVRGLRTCFLPHPLKCTASCLNLQTSPASVCFVRSYLCSLSYSIFLLLHTPQNTHTHTHTHVQTRLLVLPAIRRWVKHTLFPRHDMCMLRIAEPTCGWWMAAKRMRFPTRFSGRTLPRRSSSTTTGGGSLEFFSST